MRTALFPLHPLPDFPLSEHEPLSQGFLALGLRSFVDAARYVWELPYGHNSDRADFRLVLPEGRGTAPEDLGAVKEEKLRAFIRAWAARRGLDPERIWRVRETLRALISPRPAAGGR